MNKYLRIVLLIIVLVIFYLINNVPIIMDTYQMDNPTAFCLEPCPITVTNRVTLRDYIERRI